MEGENSQSENIDSRSEVSEGNADTVQFIDDGDDDDEMAPIYDRGGARGKRGARKRGFLKDDLAKMMRGFGESGEPREDTLDLLEAMVYEFTNNLVQRSL
jgi:hypothetical protein